MTQALSRTLLTGVERVLRDDQIIVSKTDPFGRITYANDTFLELSGYTEGELLGAAHSILRHPGMPASVFALLWQRLTRGEEIFAVVVNRAKNGDHYWVHAHVTPSIDTDGVIRGHHSFRRKVEPRVIEAVEGVYRNVLAIESQESTRAGQVRVGLDALRRTFGDLEKGYDRWSWEVAP